MIDDLHFLLGFGILGVVVVCSSFVNLASGLAYPGAPAELVPEGPLRTILLVDVVYLVSAGLLHVVS